MQVTLFIPAALYPAMRGWADPLEGLALPAWQALLQRVPVQQFTQAPLEWLAQQAKVSALSGWAQWCARADGLPPCPAGQRLCVTPVNLSAQRDKLVLNAPSAIILQAEQTQAYLNCLNQHFAADGVVFHAPTPTRWYVDFPRVMAVTTHPPFAVVGQSIDGYLPQGADAPLLARWLTEIQMLLYQHPLYDEQEAKHHLPVNSLWWWGEGQAPVVDALPWQTVFTSNPLWTAFAQQAGADVQMCPAQWSMQGETLWHIETLLAPWQAGDVWAWREALQALERTYLVPLWHAWQQGKINQLTLCASGEGQLRIWQRYRQSDWAFWRRSHSLTQALCLG